MTAKAGCESVLRACMTILGMDSPRAQREAAVVLATYDIGRSEDVWQAVLSSAIPALAKIKESDEDGLLRER